jgi:hypothetical protein
MEKLIATSNIANKVRNTRLPRTKPLMPLFEVISNSIHSINDAVEQGIIKKDDGKITILCIRNGSDDTLKELSEIDNYPIHSFKITDNGMTIYIANTKIDE